MRFIRDLHAATLVCAGFAGLCGSAFDALALEPNQATPNPLAQYDKTTLKSFVAAPLFDSTRQLPPPLPAPVVFTALPPAAAPPESPPTIHLLGVISGKEPVAMIGGGGTGKTELLHSGDHLGGWTVEVLPVGLRVRNGLRAFEYGMFKTGADAGPVPVEPPAALAAAH